MHIQLEIYTEEIYIIFNLKPLNNKRFLEIFGIDKMEKLSVKVQGIRKAIRKIRECWAEFQCYVSFYFVSVV
jgi:hypothetical protein